MTATQTMDIKWMDRDGVADDEFREYAEDKLAQLDGIWRHMDETSVRLTSLRGLITAEITLFSGGVVVRGEERANSERAAFDNAYARLERQLRRYTKRARARQRRQNNREEAGIIVHPTGLLHNNRKVEDDEEEVAPVRVKRFSVKPMTPEEASLQMEMLGHSFFVFRHAENNEVHVVYRRGDGGYGLIETVID